jgi:uncharacterized SAM-binding protein YcdF (DUF218 family)
MKKISKNGLWLIFSSFFLLGGIILSFTMTGRDIVGYIFMGIAVLIAVFHYLKKHNCRKTIITLISLLLAGSVVLGFAVAPVIAGSKTDKNPEAKYLVVLGAGVNGTVPSVTLYNRMNAAYDYLEEYPNSIAIVSGGQGSGESITEAYAMKTWLVNEGIDSSRIIEEKKSTSTMENLKFSFAIITERGDEPSGNVALVSSEYHLYRAKKIAESLGVTVKGIAGHTTLPLMMVNYFIREGLASIYMWFFGVK